MEIFGLRDVHREGLQEQHRAATQVAEALPKLAISIGFADFRKMVRQQALEAERHKSQLAAALTAHGIPKSSVIEPNTSVLLEKATSYVGRISDTDLLDAVLLSVLRLLVHHRMVACGLVRGHAEALSFAVDQHTLTVIADELRAADRDLAGLQKEVTQLALMVNLSAYL